jgi:hypothetical protein
LVKWKPPSVGIPKVYEVRFYRLLVNSRRETIRSLDFEATLMTPHTEIRVPPGVLSSGKTYYMRVIAEAFSNPNYATQPFGPRGFPAGEARFTSGIITVR